MSVSFLQYCIVGIKVYREDITTIDSPAEYELQNVYDVKTGKVASQNSVLIKNQQDHLLFYGEKFQGNRIIKCK